jgi:23S rRNA pseudouridine2604 synthase
MSWTKTFAETEPQRVNKWLAQSGVCSRREAEDLIARGLVSIDGVAVLDAGHKIAPGQTLVLGDGALGAQTSVVIHKPVGIVSSQPEGEQIPAARLLRRENQVGAGPMPGSKQSLPALGRLDQDSRGLLILSDDGVLAKAIIGPESNLEKEYRVRVRGEITDRKLELLRHGLELDGRQLKPARVAAKGDLMGFILREGRNRQIRRMCELVELEVYDLLRVRIGPLLLGDLHEGRWRHLTDAERAALISGS